MWDDWEGKYRNKGLRSLLDLCMCGQDLGLETWHVTWWALPEEGRLGH